MTSLLLRLFVKDYENTESVAVHSAIGRLAGFTGIICNLLLFLGKLTVGWLATPYRSLLTPSTTYRTPLLRW